MYIFGVCVLQLSVDEHESQIKGEGSLNWLEYQTLVYYFGSMIKTIYTLWMSICGGLDWGEAAAPLLKMSPLLCVFFSIYIAMSVLCVLNIITGVFVENANLMYSADIDEMMMDQALNKVM